MDKNPQIDIDIDIEIEKQHKLKWVVHEDYSFYSASKLLERQELIEPDEYGCRRVVYIDKNNQETYYKIVCPNYNEQEDELETINNIDFVFKPEIYPEILELYDNLHEGLDYEHIFSEEKLILDHYINGTSLLAIYTKNQNKFNEYYPSDEINLFEKFAQIGEEIINLST